MRKRIAFSMMLFLALTLLLISSTLDQSAVNTQQTVSDKPPWPKKVGNITVEKTPGLELDVEPILYPRVLGGYPNIVLRIGTTITNTTEDATLVHLTTTVTRTSGSRTHDGDVDYEDVWTYDQFLEPGKSFTKNVWYGSRTDWSFRSIDEWAIMVKVTKN